MITILGTGQVGIAILEQLQKLKPESNILLVNKSGKVDFALPHYVKLVGTDVTNSESLIPIFSKSEIVFSCTDLPYQFWGDFYPKLSNAMIVGLQH